MTLNANPTNIYTWEWTENIGWEERASNSVHGFVHDAAFSSTGDLLAFSATPDHAGDCCARLFEIYTGNVLSSIDESWIRAVRFFPDNQKVILILDETPRSIKIWDIQSGEYADELIVFEGESYRNSFFGDMALSSSGTYLFIYDRYMDEKLLFEI